jgi:2,3-dihydroxybiphenyl 1,2-dioxygenase
MTITALGYIGLGTEHIEAWRDFATAIMGVQAIDYPDGSLRLRYDEQPWRILVTPAEAPDLFLLGWEVAGPAEMATTIARLAAAGVAVERGSRELAADRDVEDLAVFTDPAGLRCELFWGGRLACRDRFVSPAGVAGFVTGEQGMGHLAVSTPRPDKAIGFYQDVLGFRLSDFIDLPLSPDLTLPITFLHCNPRHHSIAFAPAPGPHTLIHAMVQMTTIDDVGLAYDRVRNAGVPVSITLGRHSNDHMFSFYCRSPDGLEIEIGADARVIDDATWRPRRYDQISLWGHAFTAPPPPPSSSPSAHDRQTFPPSEEQ